ncbi:MAG: hypothetical protein AAF657_34940, partial [Acidobacteriota bacterium]
MRAFAWLLLGLFWVSPAPGQTIAVNVPAEMAERLSELRIDDWISWLRRTNETLEVIAGPNVRGDVEILVRPLPVDDSIR